MTKYFFVAASEKFLTVEEPLEEILKERVRNYKENNKEIDFWLLKNPSFLQTTQFVDLTSKIPYPPAAVLSTDKKFITFLKLRLEFVAVGEFECPNAEITDPFKVE
ncbi:MgPME-cyclase complex family protein [uncultured Prochlorococcus sp.]|uniref:MgPME-cyclase complex family protein n=1 Tax=uncultured Prochlorococcus sp. TaxID=159733 RepID=UPI0025863091|nr:MgPME-cyclase complex family protein [uncultured Prochlorococcus sp.]